MTGILKFSNANLSAIIFFLCAPCISFFMLKILAGAWVHLNSTTRLTLVNTFELGQKRQPWPGTGGSVTRRSGFIS
jgi:hypothetical protein